MRQRQVSFWIILVLMLGVILIDQAIYRYYIWQIGQVVAVWQGKIEQAKIELAGYRRQIAVIHNAQSEIAGSQSLRPSADNEANRGHYIREE